MALNTSSGDGVQTSTSSPQTVGASSTTSNNAASSSRVQTGTASSLLNSGGGIALGSSSPTLVNLSATTQTTQASSTPQTPAKHTNTTALIFCGVLFVIAIVAFVVMNRSAKNTT